MFSYVITILVFVVGASGHLACTRAVHGSVNVTQAKARIQYVLLQTKPIFDQYIQMLNRTNFVGGLVAERGYSRTSNFTKTCQTANSGYRFPDATFYTGLYLAALGLWYSAETDEKVRTQILLRVNEILGALDRLSRYSSRASYQLTRSADFKQIGSLGDQARWLHSALRSAEPSGYIIRSDLGREFQQYELVGKKNHNIEPSQDQYTTIVFGLLMVRRLIPDKSIRGKVKALASKIQSYLVANDYFIKRPFDDRLVARGGSNEADRGPILMAYPLHVALSYVRGVNPIESISRSKFAFYKNRFMTASHLITGSVDARCDSANFLSNLIKCNYFTYVLFAFGHSFLAVDPHLPSNYARQLFVSAFPPSVTQNHQNLLIAGLYFYFFEGAIDESLVAILSTAPAHTLPNQWSYNNGWFVSLMRWDRPPEKFRGARFVASKKPCQYQYPGLDFILPYSLFYAGIRKF